MWIHIGWWYCADGAPIMWFGGIGCENISVGAGEWLSIGEGYAGYGVPPTAECTAWACGGNAGCRIDPEVEDCTAGD